jgi:hypothetical protein
VNLPSNALVACGDNVFQRLEELCRMIHSHRLANGQKFHDVDPALTTLIFGHKRLKLMKTISQLALSQTCGFAFTKRIRFTKDGPDDFKHRMCANIAAFIFLVALAGPAATDALDYCV